MRVYVDASSAKPRDVCTALTPVFLAHAPCARRVRCNELPHHGRLPRPFPRLPRHRGNLPPQGGAAAEGPRRHPREQLRRQRHHPLPRAPQRRHRAPRAVRRLGRDQWSARRRQFGCGWRRCRRHGGAGCGVPREGRPGGVADQEVCGRHGAHAAHADHPQQPQQQQCTQGDGSHCVRGLWVLAGCRWDCRVVCCVCSACVYAVCVWWCVWCVGILSPPACVHSRRRIGCLLSLVGALCAFRVDSHIGCGGCGDLAVGVHSA